MKLQLQIFLLVLATSAALLGALAVVLPGRVEPYLVERLETELKQEALAEIRHVIYWLSLVAFSITSVLAYFFSRRFSLSAAELAQSAHRVASGDLEARAPIRGSSELRTLGRAFNAMTEKLISQIRDGAAENQKLQAILEGMREGVLMTDPRGKVEFMNPSCYEMFGLHQPAEGRRLIEVVRQSDLAQAVQQAVASRESQQLEIELHAVRKTLLASLHPVLQEERAKGVVVVFLDVTELRRLENVRKDFVANVSHELRTPLTSIQGYAETLLEHPNLDAPVRDNFISIIDKQARWLNNLIEDLLKLSSLESGRAESETETVDIADVAQSVTDSMQNLFDAKSITCTCEANGNTKARANRRGVEQILYNLLDNTLKYTPQGGSVQVRVARIEDQVEIAVQDSGIGIPAEDLPRIFERFYRVDRSRNRKLGGTGLGLAIVKHVLQQQGGTIRVESRLDEGSTFIFQLPAA